MEHHQAGMARKWERHFLTTRTTVSYAIMLFGVCFGIPLFILYPQIFNVTVFNSRLAQQLIVSSDNYATCDINYESFIINEPATNIALYQFYFFNISNAPDVFQRGNKPAVTEVGPYAYKKKTYKYDVTFDPIDSSTVSFKEYILLEAVTDTSVCAAMYHIMGSDFQSLDNPCDNGACNCRDPNEVLTIVNPLFEKLIWQESAQELVARFSSAVFSTIEALMLGEFITAVKAQLVHVAYQEIFFFRLMNMVGPVLTTGIDYLRVNFTAGSILTDQEIYALMFGATNKLPSSCGLSKYGISGCPLWAKPSLDLMRIATATPNSFDTDTDYPSLYNLIHRSSDGSASGLSTELAALNSETLINIYNASGLAKLVGLAYCIGVISDFNGGSGYSMMNSSDCAVILAEVNTQIYLSNSSFFTSNMTSNQVLGTQIMLKGLLFFMCKTFYSANINQLYLLVHAEFGSTYTPVICSPLGDECMWQFGYMNKYHGSTNILSEAMIYDLIDFRASGNTQPNNFIYDANSGPMYNTYKYCQIVYPNPDNYDKCLNISYTFNDALTYQPAGLWGIDHGITAVNASNLYRQFAKTTPAVKLEYQQFACNTTTLLFEVYPQITPFHDKFVVKFLNRKKDVNFPHMFNYGQWDDIGYAQWGSGAITWAMLGVRSIAQVIRNGMWVIGDVDYINQLVEFGSWCLFSAYPQALIYNVTESRILLNSLADSSESGVQFKYHIVRIATTLVGDGTNIVNGVGYEGEVVYVTQQNLGLFACNGTNKEACNIIKPFYNSSAEFCEEVQAIYTFCLQQSFAGNNWATDCGIFETAITSSDGVQCDTKTIFGHNHPYIESRGNILFSMLIELLIHLVLQQGLWCDSIDQCLFNLGGLFVTTSVKKVLFEGFSDPSVLKFLSLKHASDNVTFYCAANAVSACGKSNLLCNDEGIIMSLPGPPSAINNNNTFLLRYNITEMDQYFAPTFYIHSQTGRMYWPFAMNATLAQQDREEMMSLGYDPTIYTNYDDDSKYYHWNVTSTHQPTAAPTHINTPTSPPTLSTSSGSQDGDDYYTSATPVTNTSGLIVAVFNPMWAAHPAWDSGNVAFNKYLQCQRLYFGGAPNMFTSCVDTLTTGMIEIQSALNIKSFAGSESAPYFDSFFTVNGSTFPDLQLPMYLWDGFDVLPYSYFSENIRFDEKTEVDLFDKKYGFWFPLSQSSLSFAFERDIGLPFPIAEAWGVTSVAGSQSTPLRRFVEDVDSWSHFQEYGTPKDSYGMPYTVPIGMASLERTTKYPLFVSTVQCFGNEAWGGHEYSDVSGYDMDPQNPQPQRTFVDYEPITGKAYRTALRQQIMVRMERGPLTPNIISSQSRCTVPTHTFNGGNAYGCTAFVPVYWSEDMKVLTATDFFKYYDHFYTRPDRANMISIAGITVGIIIFLVGAALLIYERFQKKKFMTRVYIDG